MKLPHLLYSLEDAYLESQAKVILLFGWPGLTFLFRFLPANDVTPFAQRKLDDSIEYFSNTG